MFTIMDGLPQKRKCSPRVAGAAARPGPQM